MSGIKGRTPHGSNGRSAQLRRLAGIILIALILVQVARLIAHALAPAAGAVPASVGPDLIDISILERFDPFDAAAVAGSAPSAVPSGLRLFGLRTGVNGGAILAGPDGAQTSYGVGEEIQPGLRLSSVQQDHIVLNRNGMVSRLYFENQTPAEAPPPPPPAPPPAVIPSPAPTPSSLGGGGAVVRGIDVARLGQEIGLSPAEGGGYVVQPRGGGVLLALAGLRAGDVITAVDGQPLTAGQGATLANRLAGRSSAAITFVRDGQPKTVSLQVPRL